MILNGSDCSLYHPEGYQPWDGKEAMSLVTHHWGAHWMKGFDIYERLDSLLKKRQFENKITFTYIGNLPEGFAFHNAAYIEPKNGVQLASLLRQHHVYLTASRNEPGGNHQNEGAQCGLPCSTGKVDVCQNTVMVLASLLGRRISRRNLVK